MRTLTKSEIEKLRTDSKRDREEEKGAIAEFTAKYKLEQGINTTNM
jgi:hypothetical protein